jgi:delta 1-pyrroline-5-carboxylate dehydrogenase
VIGLESFGGKDGGRGGPKGGKRYLKLKLATEGTEITEFLKPKKYKDKRQVSKAIRLRRTKVEKRNFLYN